MKKNFQRALSVVLTSAMTMGMIAGCGSTAATGTAATGETSAAATDAASGVSAADTAAEAVSGGGVDSYTPFATNVTLKVPVYDRGVEGVPTVNDNYWTKWIQTNFGDKYNITVEYVPITRTDVMTDYALLAASDSLPTILMEYDYPKVAQWANDGYLATFNMDDFAKVAPTYYNRMVEQKQLDYSKMNGETYFCLAERPFYNTNFYFQTFVRMDWLKQVGYDHVPTTRAEYVDAMKKIQEAKISEHPAGGSQVPDAGPDQNYSYRTYPMDETEWAMYGDVNTPSLGWDPNYKLLKRANEDYNAGYTNPEYYITDDETNKADFVNGKIYSYAGYISANMDWLTSFYKNNPDAELAITPMASVDQEGGTVPAWRADNPFGMIVGFSSSASEDQIKAAWMYMEWMAQKDNLFTMQWGVEGQNYNTDATTKLPVSVGDYAGDSKQGYNNNVDYWCIESASRTAGTAEDAIAAVSPQGLPQDFTQDIIKYYNDKVELVKKGYACSDCLFGVALDAETEYSGSLKELYKEDRDKLTMCKPEEFDALYKQLTKEYNDAGYQELTNERKEAYEAGKTTKLQAAQ